MRLGYDNLPAFGRRLGSASMRPRRMRLGYQTLGDDPLLYIRGLQ